MEKYVKTHSVRDVNRLLEGTQVLVTGWIYSKRTHGGLVFLNLRDSTGIIQITLHRDRMNSNDFETVLNAPNESSIAVIGNVRVDKRAPRGVEINCKEFKLISPSCEDYPIKSSSGKEFLLDNRHLHIRSSKVNAVLKVRSELLKAARNWFDENDFIEVLCPLLITAACEGGATLFEVNYFNRLAYLSQSVQLYQEAAITSLERVYSIEPSFRSEMSRTRRHLTEFWQMEAEVANADLEDIMKVQEQLLTSISNTIIENCKEEFMILRCSFNPLEPPFPRITYDKALELLKEVGKEVCWGEDFGAEEERVLSKQFDTPFFVKEYPRSCKAFYHKPKENNFEVTLSADFMVPGHGEIAGGGERINDLEVLIDSLNVFDLKQEDYEWYLDLRRYGSVVHSGFGMGTERVLRWILKLPHIRDAVMFPRTPSRVYP